MKDLVFYSILLILLLILVFILLYLLRKHRRSFTFNKLKYIKHSGNTVECITYEGVCPTGSLVIPAYVKENKKLKVASIGKSAFLYCGHITSVQMEEGITAIGSFAFQNCGKLASVTIPSSVTTIGSYAFANCTALRTIISRNPVPPHIGLHTFSNVDTTRCVLYVPEDADLMNRSAEKWKNFNNIQHEETDKK